MAPPDVAKAAPALAVGDLQDFSRLAGATDCTVTELAVTWEELSHRASTHERMHRWQRTLERRCEHARLLVDLGAPDHRFDDLIAELETFQYCVAALAFSDGAAS